MTDETPSTPGTFVCPEKGCRSLIPDTIEDKREHRRGHEHDAKVEEAMRRSLRELRADFGTLRGAVRDDVRAIREEVSGIDRAVGQIEIPEPVAPLTITRGGWDDDDAVDEPADEVDDDDWGFRPDEPEPDEQVEGDETSTSIAGSVPAGDPSVADTAADPFVSSAPAWRRG